VFTNIFVIGERGESAEEFRPGGDGGTRSRGAAEEHAEEAEEIRRKPAPETAEVAENGGGQPGAPFSPRARRFAEEHRFHPAAVTGSGPGGRVLEQDLRAIYVAAPAAVPVSNIREKIARRMRESLSTTAQYTLNATANAGGLLAVRARIKESGATPDININDLVAFCTVKALLAMPDVNAEYRDGKIVKHSEVHLGFACDTPRGLMVPVIRNAHQMSAGQLATAAKELSARAVQGSIAPDDLSGATFTVSNLGGLGIESFTPLLNPPQVAILGVGAIQLKPVRGAAGVEFVDAIGLSLTCDHQVVDGAPGARFLKVVREQIENVEVLCPSPSS